jgi:hypothetical protein
MSPLHPLKQSKYPIRMRTLSRGEIVNTTNGPGRQRQGNPTAEEPSSEHDDCLPLSFGQSGIARLACGSDYLIAMLA